MRGRKPHRIVIAAADRLVLDQLARCRQRPWFQVARARVILGLAGGRRTSDLATQMGCSRRTIWRLGCRYQETGLAGLLAERLVPVDRPRSFPVQRAQIVALACLEPLAEGLHVTHWASQDLARQVVDDRIAKAISPRTVRRILQEVALQPHRTRYWKTSRLDGCFKTRAEKVLWCYANASRLAEQGIWVVCVDEMPNLQVLERSPIRRAIPGLIERQEFEYVRHGTVNVLLFLVVHTGRMQAMCLPVKDASHYQAALETFRRQHRHLRAVFLIQDGDATHTAAATEAYFQKHPWWRPRFTPIHASWLNQAELLNGTFAHRYLQRRSWKSRQEFMDHVHIAWPEYNRRYAHPFEWTWTNHRMRLWFAKHAH